MITYNSEGVPLLACLFLYTFLAIPEIVLNTLSQEIAHLGVDKKVPQAIRASAPPPFPPTGNASWLPYSTYLYLGFHWLFHDKAKRAQQENLLGQCQIEGTTKSFSAEHLKDCKTAWLKQWNTIWIESVFHGIGEVSLLTIYLFNHKTYFAFRDWISSTWLLCIQKLDI